MRGLDDEVISTVRRSLRGVAGLAAVVLVLAACSADRGTGTTTTSTNAPTTSADLEDDLRRAATPFGENLDVEAVRRLAASGDLRAAWLLADVLRFVPSMSPPGEVLVDALATLTGLPLAPEVPGTWVVVMDDLITRDVPAPPNYATLKGSIYGELDPLLETFLEDPDNAFDIRFVTWGGVRPDQRPLGENLPCSGCIPALDYPRVTTAEEATWLQDQRIVFGVVVDGEARAYPRHQMEVHEMVNDTLGGREIAMPYCTLCGAAQAFYADDVAGVDRLVLRTSGLLHRSNKVSYDLATGSFFDTFAGVGVSGELRGVELTQIPVVTSTWGEWKADHPDTTVVGQDGGIGRTYEDDPLQGRDANGPIFPVGPIDDRLFSVDRVVTATTPDGTPVAFPVTTAGDALEAGESVTAAGVRLVADGSGFRVETVDGEALVSHEAYWFAWSQFNPDTVLWEP